MRLLTKQLNGDDRVAMLVYGGASGLALPLTSANHQRTILKAIGKLESGGSSDGGQGIRLAYQPQKVSETKHGR